MEGTTPEQPKERLFLHTPTTALPSDPTEAFIALRVRYEWIMRFPFECSPFEAESMCAMLQRLFDDAKTCGVRIPELCHE